MDERPPTMDRYARTQGGFRVWAAMPRWIGIAALSGGALCAVVGIVFLVGAPFGVRDSVPRDVWVPSFLVAITLLSFGFTMTRSRYQVEVSLLLRTITVLDVVGLERARRYQGSLEELRSFARGEILGRPALALHWVDENAYPLVAVFGSDEDYAEAEEVLRVAGLPVESDGD